MLVKMSLRRKIFYLSVLILILSIVVGSGIYVHHIGHIRSQFWRGQMKDFVREIKPGMTNVEVMAIIDKKPWRNKIGFIGKENEIRVVTPLELNLGRNWVVYLYFSNGRIARIHIGEFTNPPAKPIDAPNDINFVSP